MGYYFILYGFSIILLTILGFQIFKQYRNTGGFFFALSGFFGSIWCLFYYLFFTGITNPEMLTYISRIAFYFGVISLYSFLFFIYFFRASQEKILTKKTLGIGIYFLVLGYVYIFTDKVIAGVNLVEGVFREIYGSWYSITPILYSIFILSFIVLIKKRIKVQEGLNKIRLKRIALATFVLTFVLILLLTVLPLCGIWVLEKDIIFLYLFFIIYIWASLKKYYFSSSIYNTGKILMGILSGMISVVSLNILKYYFVTLNTGMVVSYWGWNDEFSIIDSIVVIVIYIIFYKYIRIKMLGTPSIMHIKNAMREIEKKISQFTDMESVGKTLNKGLHHLFHSERAYIELFKPEETNNNELQRFFLKENKHELFISDIAFMDEHKKDYDIGKIQKQIPKDIIIVIPLYSMSNINIGGLFIGKKPFGDFYTENEIKTLKEFAFFLETHLKYIRVYDMLRDMTENLDKKVDEKTLEYNDLINRQKDFIRMISHEIRSPIGSAIFQSDSIIDDIESGKYNQEYIKEELNILSEQLIKTGEILTKLFSVEYYDVHSVSLFRENIDIYTIFDEEIRIAVKTNPKIHFINAIEKNIGFALIDKIQFRQVITNLISNAIKFATNEKPTILIEGYKKDGFIWIGIEDNGPGFDGIDTENIFDKYTIGKGNRVGLGMGLYLCKRILEMHSGKIQAKPGSHLGGARFDIIIPIS